MYVCLQWDYPRSSERFTALISPYIRFHDMFLVLYDATRRETFDAVESWYGELRAKGPPSSDMVLVANKCDQPGGVVSSEDGQVR